MNKTRFSTNVLIATKRTKSRLKINIKYSQIFRSFLVTNGSDRMTRESTGDAIDEVQWNINDFHSADVFISRRDCWLRIGLTNNTASQWPHIWYNASMIVPVITDGSENRKTFSKSNSNYLRCIVECIYIYILKTVLYLRLLLRIFAKLRWKVLLGSKIFS